MVQAMTWLLAGGPLTSASAWRRLGRRGPAARAHLLMAIAAALVVLLASVSVAHAQATTATVTAVAITSGPGTDNTYALGDTITVSLTFSEAVAVTGSPYVTLDIGGQPRNAAYSSAGAATGQILFGYTVRLGDRDTDGITVLANSLTLNGGAIQSADDSAGASLDHSASTFANHKVDTYIPLLSNIGQTDASGTITVSETESATVSFTIPARPSELFTEARRDLTLRQIVLDVKIASGTLDVAIQVTRDVSNDSSLGITNKRENYRFSGPVSATGKQVFTLDDPYQRLADLIVSGTEVAEYTITISGTGSGSVEIGATTAGGEDTGGLQGMRIANPPSGETVPRFSLHGHDGVIPFIYHAEIISNPADGAAYQAGERIEASIVFSRGIEGRFPQEAELRLGTAGAEQSRTAGLVADTDFDITFHRAVYAYTVRSGDNDTDGIRLGENPLGRNADFDATLEFNSAVPADLTLPTIQLGTGQHVNGSQERTCDEIGCIQFRNDFFSTATIESTGFVLNEIVQYLPLQTFGEPVQSGLTFGYGGEEHLVATAAFVNTVDTRVLIGANDTIAYVSGDFLLLTIFPPIPDRAADRLSVLVDESLFPLHLSESPSGLGGISYWWTEPGLTWSEDDLISLKLIENTTATFGSASEAVDEGGSVEVTVTLADYFTENTVTVPLEVAGREGATADDYSGVPESLTFLPGVTDQTFTMNIVDDAIDDDDESVILKLGHEPHIKKGGAYGELTISIRDDDDPVVEISFDQGSYSVPEGDAQTVRVTLSADPERTVAIPITVTPQGGVTGADYDHTALPLSLTFNAGETVRTITFVTTQDGVDDDDESVKLAFGSPLPHRVSIGSVGETTLHIGDDDDPPVEISFEHGSYTVPEAGTQTVRVTLDADPEREVTVLIVVTHQDGATGADYSGVPESLVFAPAETEKTFDFSATQDTVDDDGESVRLTFGNLPPRVSRGSHGATTLHIGDDDDPVVEVQFEHAEYGVFEGGVVTVAVVLSADPERTVTVPLTRTNEGGATGSDYSGVPASVTFNSGETRQTFVFEALEDIDDEAGESVKLGFGTRPDRVGPGANDETTVTIRDCEGGGIWCGTLKFGVLTESAAGRKWLIREHLDYDQFVYNGITYGIGTITLRRNRGGVTNPGAPFSIPERATFSFSLDNLSAANRQDQWTMPNEDYLDWTLHISADNDGETLEAALPFNEAKFCCGYKWRSYGLDLDELNAAWEPDKLYKLRIVEDPRADRVPEALGPPLYLEVTGFTRRSVGIRWVRPQIRNDGAPPGVSYRTQWKESAGSWDTEDDVSEQVYEPRPGKEWLFYTIRGLTPGVRYNVRVIAVNTVGDSEPSNVVTGRTEPDPARAQQAEPGPNNPATGAPGISGTPSVGGTLTADVSGISDADGLENAAFTYQWLAGETEIANATGATYTVVSADEGKAIRVRVDFTDDSGNEETLTSAATEAVAAAGLRLDSATVNGATLSLTYNEALDEGVSIPTGAFTVAVDGSDRPVANVSVSGSGVALTLSPAVAAGETVTVDYTRPDGPDFIRDTLGNVAGSFSGQAVTNSTPEEESSAGKSEQPAANTPALGAPKIRGTAREGETLTVDTSGISDEDGMENASFAYQWTAGSDDIAGATGSGYTLVPADEGKAIKVRVSFTDDAGNEETLTSGGTDAVAPKPNSPATGQPTITGTAQVGHTLMASASGIADEDGMENASFAYQWTAGSDDIAGATGSGYILVPADEGKAIKVRVGFTDDSGNEESVTSAATDAVAAKPNSPATGQPTITGMAQTGRTLTANTSGIADEDGLEKATFSYQWIAGDADIQGATNSTYTLVSTDEGKAIKVRVGFTDDAGNRETLTSSATAAVEGAPEPLTASFLGTPTTHDGRTAFTFELRFSEEFGLSYKTLRDHAFTVTGGTVKKAKRLEKGSNIRWQITVEPASNAAVSVVLPVTTDCDDRGAVCTEDGRKLSNRNEFTVSGVGG